jgi:hypothetical protein
LLMMPLALATMWLELKFLDNLFVKRTYTGPVPVPFVRAELITPDHTATTISPVPVAAISADKK